MTDTVRYDLLEDINVPPFKIQVDHFYYAGVFTFSRVLHDDYIYKDKYNCIIWINKDTFRTLISKNIIKIL